MRRLHDQGPARSTVREWVASFAYGAGHLLLDRLVRALLAIQPDTELPEEVRSNKKTRQDWIQSPDTRWNYWTLHVGKNKAQRVSKSNPPMLTGGFAVDLDHPEAFKQAELLIEGLPFKPMWIETYPNWSRLP